MGCRSCFRIQAACPRTLLLFGLVVVAGCNPMAAWTNNQSGKAFYRAGRYAEAREEFRRATADSPRNPDYFHNYATASRRAGDAATAEMGYQRALALDPAHQPSYHGLAVTYLDTGRTAEAHSLLSNWVASQPHSEKPYIEMAWLQKEMGDLTGAERSLVQALQLRPNHPLAMANLGQVYEQTGRTQQALGAYQRSLTADWNQPQVAGRIRQIQQAGGPVVALAPSFPLMANVPGPVVTTRPGAAATAAGGSGPTPVPPYRQTTDSSTTRDPFAPASRTGLAPNAFRPGANLPLARTPFEPNASAPLASKPFPTNQAFLNVPTSPAPSGTAVPPSIHPASATTPLAAPYFHAPR